MQTALVIGLGISGRAACELLFKAGYNVLAIDDKVAQCPELEKIGIKLVSDKDKIDFHTLDLVIPSPGIATTHPLYQEALQNNIPLVGEAQLALQKLTQSSIGITGTNGKTTVTSLVTHVLCSSGKKARSLGNIGDPLSLYALSPVSDEILVIELSSYQLETMRGGLLDVAVILNITPDHLDRYASMEEYAKAKWRIQHCLKKDAPLIVYARVLEEWKKFADIKDVSSYSYPSLAVNLPTEYTKSGAHDGENIIAAWMLVRRFGVTEEQFINAIKTFRKPAHRIEHVTTINGVRYYDDSKGTNLDAVIRAVDAMDGSVWLIAGGVDKGASYALWRESFQGKVKKIFAIGQAKGKIAQEAGSFCCVEEVDTLEEATRKASQAARAGSNVLLSPGCSSFDMFHDYAHRGEEFQRFVRSLEEERRKK